MGKTASIFQKPSIEEVKAFMMEKMTTWPEAFCQYYAEKFWYSYEKSGWRLSAGRGGAMKSWTAAFHSNWKDLSYQADRDKLQTMQAQERARQAKLIQRDGAVPATASEIGAEMVDGLLTEYTAHPTMVTLDRLAACYDWLKTNLKVKLSKEQKEIVIDIAQRDTEKAKATVVQWIFESVSKSGQSFKTLLQHA